MITQNKKDKAICNFCDEYTDNLITVFNYPNHELQNGICLECWNTHFKSDPIINNTIKRLNLEVLR